MIHNIKNILYPEKSVIFYHLRALLCYFFNLIENLFLITETLKHF